jgi:hypothetical protein
MLNPSHLLGISLTSAVGAHRHETCARSHRRAALPDRRRSQAERKVFVSDKENPNGSIHSAMDGADAQTLSDLDQTASDGDQTSSDLDQTASDADQSASTRDQIAPSATSRRPITTRR